MRVRVIHLFLVVPVIRMRDSPITHVLLVSSGVSCNGRRRRPSTMGSIWLTVALRVAASPRGSRGRTWLRSGLCRRGWGRWVPAATVFHRYRSIVRRRRLRSRGVSHYRRRLGASRSGGQSGCSQSILLRCISRVRVVRWRIVSPILVVSIDTWWVRRYFVRHGGRF